MPEGLPDAQIMERLARVERNVRRLAEEAGVEIEDPAAGMDPEVVGLTRAGKRMEAAKLYAERTGADFLSAQRAVADL